MVNLVDKTHYRDYYCRTGAVIKKGNEFTHYKTIYSPKQVQAPLLTSNCLPLGSAIILPTPPISISLLYSRPVYSITLNHSYEKVYNYPAAGNSLQLHTFILSQNLASPQKNLPDQNDPVQLPGQSDHAVPGTMAV